MIENPYAPPVSGADAHAAAGIFPAREIVIGWEKLRLLYNGILALPGLIVLWFAIQSTGMPPMVAILMGLAVAAGANVCFFAGPLAELYLRGLFFRGQSLGRGRLLIFGAGIAISLALFLINFLLFYGFR